MTRHTPSEPTPVDDVRRVRERLDREAQGDIHTLAEQSRAAFEQYRQQLNLKLVSPPPREASREETA
ncbi:MAG: hypothetical protein ABFD69_14580 [Candidatus Sumerlaeia bacterium]